MRPYGVIEQTTRPGCASSHGCGSNADGGEALDHDVGAGDERLDLGVAGAPDDRAHPVVQELEQRAALVGVDGRAARPTTRATDRRRAARP